MNRSSIYSANDKFNLNINVYPVTLTGNEPERIGDMMNFWGKDPYATAKIEDYFLEILQKNNLKNLNENDGLIFLYFDDSVSGSTSYSFYDVKKFRIGAHITKFIRLALLIRLVQRMVFTMCFFCEFIASMNISISRMQRLMS